MEKITMLNTSSTEISKSVMENLADKSIMLSLTLSIAIVSFFGLQAAGVKQAEAKKNVEHIIVANSISNIEPQITMSSSSLSTVNQTFPYSYFSSYNTGTTYSF